MEVREAELPAGVIRCLVGLAGSWGAPPLWSAHASAPDASSAGQTAGCWGSVGAPVATSRPSPPFFSQLPGMSSLPWGEAVPWFPRNSLALGPSFTCQGCGVPLCSRLPHTHMPWSPLAYQSDHCCAPSWAYSGGLSVSPAAYSGPWSSLLSL